MRRLHRSGVISQAVDAIPVVDVLISLGCEVQGFPPPGTSIKIWCPFTYLHPIGKQGEKEMRLYGDDHRKVFCHICLQQFDAVSLSAYAWGCSQVEAARRLLAGTPVSVEREQRSGAHDLRVDAVAALGIWADANGVDRFGSAYRQVLDAAGRISEPEDVNKWLTASKEYLRG